MRRDDLLALTPAVLGSLSNAGLVKRAQREFAAAAPPTVEIDEEGTLRVTLADATVVAFPAGSGIEGRCPCAATGVCRHLIAAVLGYQAVVGPEPSTSPAPTEPAVEVAVETESVVEVDENETSGMRGHRLPVLEDAALADVLAARTLASARAARRQGYLATVHPAAGPDGTVVVELGTTTVRFLVGADLRYVRCDCTARRSCQHVALALWAVQEAARVLPTEDVPAAGVPAEDAPPGAVAVEVTAPPGPATLPREPTRSAGPPVADPVTGPVRRPVTGSTVASVPRDDREPADAVSGVVALVLREGLTNVGATLAVRLEVARRLAERADHGWIVFLLDRLAELHDACARRAADDLNGASVAVLAGLVARHRAAAHEPAPLPRSVLLGTGERSQTALSQRRLVGLGASVSAGDEAGSVEVEIALADTASSTLLVARRQFRPGPDGIDGPAVARRTLVPGVRVGALAVGDVVTNAAVRRADRVIEFRRGGLRRTALVPGTPALDRLAAAGVLCAPPEFEQRAAARPVRLLRPLLATEDLVAIAITDVYEAVFDAAEQCVAAIVEVSGGAAAELRVQHRDVAPGALGALAAFVAEPAPQFVVGRATMRDGMVRIEPTLLGGATLVVPDLTPLDDVGRAALAALPAARVGRPGGPAEQALAEAVSLLGELALEGTMAAERWTVLAAAGADALHRCGMAVLAQRMRALVDAVRGQPEASTGGPDGLGGPEAVAQRWADVAIAVSVGRERAAAGALAAAPA